MSEITKPILKDETFVEKMDKLNSLVASIVRENAPTELNWLMLEEFAHEGVFGDLYSFGDKFTDVWKDVVANKEYSYVWRLNHIGDYKLADGEILKNRPCFQANYAHPFGVQFSQFRAFLACPEGLSAGTYCIHFAQGWGDKLKDLDWTFTLTQDVPAGGRVSGFRTMADASYTERPVYTHSADGKTIIETVTATKGTGGTDLGTLAYSRRNGNLNSMQETFYGWNRWKTSAIRQYLNSNKGVGEWWKAQDEWDIAPDQLTKYAGFLSGCSEAFIDSIKPVEVKTYVNEVNDGTKEDYDITYDKVFLPSLDEMYIEPYYSGYNEGENHEYWKRRSGRETPFKKYTTYPELIHYAMENHSSPQSVRLRSCSRSYANFTYFVLHGGYVGSHYSYHAYRFAPLFVL